MMETLAFNFDSFLGNIGWLLAAVQVPFTLWGLWRIQQKIRRNQG